MWPFKKQELNSEALSREINQLSKRLQQKINAESYPISDPESIEVNKLMNSLGTDTDMAALQVLETNFTRAAERYKHDESKMRAILKDWRESLIIFNLIFDGKEDQFAHPQLKTSEIERRLRDLLGKEYISYAKQDRVS